MRAASTAHIVNHIRADLGIPADSIKDDHAPGLDWADALECAGPAATRAAEASTILRLFSIFQTSF
jgi:hypothetical protein